MRYLLLFLLLLIVVYYLRRAGSGDDTPQAGTPGPHRDAPAGPETMHACARCGLVVPRSEGVESQDNFFCSAEHARLGRGDGDA